MALRSEWIREIEQDVRYLFPKHIETALQIVAADLGRRGRSAVPRQRQRGVFRRISSFFIGAKQEFPDDAPASLYRQITEVILKPHAFSEDYPLLCHRLAEIAELYYLGRERVIEGDEHQLFQRVLIDLKDNLRDRFVRGIRQYR